MPFRGMQRDKLSLADKLQAKSGENHSLTKTLKEKLVELRKPLTDWFELMESNHGMLSELSRIRFDLEAEIEHVDRL